MSQAWRLTNHAIARYAEYPQASQMAPRYLSVRNQVQQMTRSAQELKYNLAVVPGASENHI